MAQTIRISDDEFYVEIKNTSNVQTRSIGEQALHWMKIGKAIEESPQFDYQRVQAALSGKIAHADLTAEEQVSFLDNFGDAINNDMDANYSKHFEHLESLEIVENFHGMNDNGKIISKK